MYDVFYKTKPTGLFAHEQPAQDIADAAAKCKTRFFWYLDGANDYSNFDWYWEPAPWENKFTHIFGTQWQRDGGAVFRAKNIENNVDHFQSEFRAVRKNHCDIFYINYGSDPLPGTVNITATGNYFKDVATALAQATSEHVWITNSMVDYSDFDFSWHPESYQNELMHIFSSREGTPGSTLFLHVESVRRYIMQCAAHPTGSDPQLVDFARIQRHYGAKLREKPLDIVYISNGEPDAERWYIHTAKCAQRPIHRVMNVPGRAEAYKAAAEMSTSDWVLTVFAKLSVSTDFPWDWQPDRTQREQHYIFHAHNPVNHLEYGHMAMIAYNKRLVLETDDWGLDFTLSRPHSVVPILSGTAHFNADAFMTWRTAFREVLKLVHTDRTSPTIPNLYRLQTWLTKAEGDFAEYSLRGAQDAVEYYESVNGDMAKLMLSFDWPWLKQYFEKA